MIKNEHAESEKENEEILKDIPHPDSETEDTIFQEDTNKGKTMAFLSYIVPIVPYIMEKKNKFVKFHARQGMNLFLVLIIYTVVYKILTGMIKVGQTLYRGQIHLKVTPWWITFPLGIVGCVLAVMDIMGIVQVFNGEAKELPVIKNLKIFK